jgi:hypothetical protein
MNKVIFIQFLILSFLFSCSQPSIPETLNGEVWTLQNQIIQVKDTIYANDGKTISNINITDFPINNNREETWTFQNQTLEIKTKLSSGQVTTVSYKVENNPEGFILKNDNEVDKFCKITKWSNDQVILEAGGIITLSRK